MQLSVKKVDKKVFREFKAEAVREGLPVGKALTLAMDTWLEKTEEKPKMNLLDLKATHWGKDTKRVSENIDKILYGK